MEIHEEAAERYRDDAEFRFAVDALIASGSAPDDLPIATAQEVMLHTAREYERLTGRKFTFRAR